MRLQLFQSKKLSKDFVEMAQHFPCVYRRGRFIECLESRDSGAILSVILLRMNSGIPVIVFMAVMPIESVSVSSE